MRFDTANVDLLGSSLGAPVRELILALHLLRGWRKANSLVRIHVRISFQRPSGSRFWAEDPGAASLRRASYRLSSVGARFLVAAELLVNHFFPRPFGRRLREAHRFSAAGSGILVGGTSWSRAFLLLPEPTRGT